MGASCGFRLACLSDRHERQNYLDWPFFEERHRKLERELDAWAAANLGDRHESDVDAACRTLVGKLGAAAGHATRSAAPPMAPFPT